MNIKNNLKYWIVPTALTFLIGILFRIMHWPLGYELMITGILTTTLIPIIEFGVYRKKNLNNIFISIRALTWGATAYLSMSPAPFAGPALVIFTFITTIWFFIYASLYYQKIKQLTLTNHFYKVLILVLAASIIIGSLTHIRYFTFSWIYTGLMIIILLMFEKKHND
jgi:hypothetical protein